MLNEEFIQGRLTPRSYSNLTIKGFSFVILHSSLMPDPAEQLQRIYLAGFQLETFERFPKAIGAVRDNVIALLEATPEGLRMIGTPGWRMGEAMGVLIQMGGRQVFQHKAEIVEATPERLQAVRRVREELEGLLTSST
jgi:hypothetical protein